jgi:hypothetical protein
MIGPCARCHELTARYGPDGDVFCADCRAANAPSKEHLK